MEIGVPFDVMQFINKEIPLKIRSKFVPLVQQAYELVDAALKDVSFFQWKLGNQHIGYLDNIAVQFTFYEASKKGILGLEAVIVPNVNKSSYHVELRTDNIVITINRAANKYVTARKAIYRSILERENQLYWNFDKQEILEEPRYLQLTHNHINRTVNFVNLGIPDGKGKWFSCIDLTKELHLVGTPKKEENKITKEKLVKFRDFAQGVHNEGGNDKL